MALAQSERRYGGKIVEADEFVGGILKDRVRSVSRAVAMPLDPVQPAAVSVPLLDDGADCVSERTPASFFHPSRAKQLR